MPAQVRMYPGPMLPIASLPQPNSKRAHEALVSSGELVLEETESFSARGAGGGGGGLL